MVTLMFILIAYAIRKKFLSDGTTKGDKILYYILSVVMTPIFGPPFFKSLMKSKPSDPSEPSSGVYICAD